VVAKHRPDAAEAGEIVHLDGRVLGRHQGIARYTVGQGRGLGEASRDGEQQLYVTGVEAGTRRVVVGPRQALPQPVVEVGEMNWLVPPPEGRLRCQVKLRAREMPREAEAGWDAAAGLLRVRPAEAAIAAPGQACVLYDGERVLGGGFIRRAAAATAAA
jgi:tRNA-specific 2-thiouridylase